MATLRRTRNGRKFTTKDMHEGNFACSFSQTLNGEDCHLTLSVRNSEEDAEGNFLASLSYSVVLNLDEMEQLEKFVADMRAKYLTKESAK